MASDLWTPAGSAHLGVAPVGDNAETGGKVIAHTVIVKVKDRFGVEHKQLVYEQGKQILRSNFEELVSLGILRRYDDGGVGYNDQRMAPLLAGGIYQNRFRMDTQFAEIDASLKKLETRS